MIYIVILLAIVACVWYFDLHGATRHKWILFWTFCITFIVVSGLRYRIGTDTIVYMMSWDRYGDFWDFDWVADIKKFRESSIHVERFQPGWVLYCMAIKAFIPDVWGLQLVTAILINSAIFRTIKKYSEYPFLTILIFYISFKFIEFEFEIMREAVAESIYLFLAFDAYVERKWKKYYIGTFLTYLMHPSALLMFILPLLRNVDWSLKKYSFLFVIPSYAIGIAGHVIVGNLVNIFLGGDDFVSQYSANAMEVETNANYAIMFSVQPVLLYMMSALFFKHFKNKEFVPLVFFTIIFMNLSLIYFTTSRLANYIILIVFIAETPLMMHLIRKFRTVWIAVLCMLAYFSPTLFDLQKPVNLARYYPYQWVIDPHETPLQKSK